MEDNKERFKAKNKMNYENNKDEINAKRKVKYTCICGRTIRKDEKTRHDQCKFHLQYTTKLDQIQSLLT